jgi:type I restriction enzyme R subunit
MPDQSDQGYSEDSLIEQPAIELFSSLGYETSNCFYEKVGESSTLGRVTTQEVVLVPRLRAALERLNPVIAPEGIQQAIEQLTEDRSTLHPVLANREIYRLLKDGVRVMVQDAKGEEHPERVRVIDWENAEQNDFFLASQFWISGEMYKRRADVIAFVNGLPLVFIELKAVHRRLETAYYKNINDYKSAIPQAFAYTAFVLVSNGSQTKVGTMSAPWEHFNEWKKISDEHERGVVSLETVIRGTCDKRRLLDLVENFTLFTTDPHGVPIKVIAKNHQYLGVNNALKAVERIEANQGRLGVFWHTQGSGKSFSMIFLSQKVFRKLPGNWTFLVVTDRQELDGQIYKEFQAAGAVTEQEVQAESAEHLNQLLREDHRHVFTLIQKFRTEKGQAHPKLSDRSDVIVMTDEAHRTQYDILARNMRSALPAAAFIGFTATPLIAAEEKTREVFGDYVSIYDYQQSVEDHATVPLYYENRIPELQLINENFNAEMEDLLEAAELDEAQEKKLEREFGREYHLLTRDERLEKIAEDIVSHFMGRGYQGKAMVVSVDKATAVRMYDKVKKRWGEYREELEEQLAKSKDDGERKVLEEKIRYMNTTDMAVVVSQAQNEMEDMKKKGLDILPHRKRMVAEDLEKKFKGPADPFRLVFVCAMWMTGFDVPSCSTIYLDKPMRNHTLMQTIARANRVFRDKTNGLIVDYVGVFRDLEKALAIYGSGPGGERGDGESPVEDKEKLRAALRDTIKRMDVFCKERGVDLVKIHGAKGFDRVKLIDDAVDALVVYDESKRGYVSLAAEALRIYKAVLPDAHAEEFRGVTAAIAVIAEKIRSLALDPDISAIVKAVEALLDRSIAAEGYVIPAEPKVVDLSRVDFEALRRQFDKGRKHTEAERLRAAVERKVKELVRLNRTRMDYEARLRQLIEDYNTAAINVEEFFKRLVTLAQALSDEEKRGISESLSEEELAIFDLLTKPALELTEKEKKQIKAVAKELLQKVTQEKLVLDWRKRQQSRAQVRVTIEEVLDKGLPEKFPPDLYRQKCDVIYQHFYDSYFGEGKSIYARSDAA